VLSESERAPRFSIALCNEECEAGDPLRVIDGTRRSVSVQAEVECSSDERNTAKKTTRQMAGRDVA
jgi:hypothetical protein